MPAGLRPSQLPGIFRRHSDRRGQSTRESVGPGNGTVSGYPERSYVTQTAGPCDPYEGTDWISGPEDRDDSESDDEIAQFLQ